MLRHIWIVLGQAYDLLFLFQDYIIPILIDST